VKPSLNDLARRCNVAQNNEEAAVLQLRLHLAAGRLATVLGVRPIVSCRFEFQLKGLGFADLAIFHANHGVTLVEVKGPVGNREACAGLGQLFMYEAALRRQLVGGQVPAYVDKILCAPLPPEKAMPTWEACQAAGVRFVHLATFKQLQESLEMAR
jgi:hypothetical protein